MEKLNPELNTKNFGKLKTLNFQIRYEKSKKKNDLAR